MNVQDMKTRLLSLVETFKEKESELTDLSCHWWATMGGIWSEDLKR